MDLAAHLGMTRRRLLDELDAEELTDWYLAWCDRPYGDDRADLRTAAGLAAMGGNRDVRLTWPYIETADDIMADFERIKQEYAEVERIQDARRLDDRD